MDWSDLAPLISPLAPTLGRLLGGALPIPFGANVGELVGRAVAAAVGAEASPDAIAATIQGTPTDVVKAQLEEAEAEAAAKWKAFAQAAAADAKAQSNIGVAQVGAVAATVQAELINGEWYQKAWRPTAMYVWVATWPVQLGTILWQIWTKDAATVASLSSILYALTAWNAGPAALAGVYSFNRTTEKVAATQMVSGSPVAP